MQFVCHQEGWNPTNIIFSPDTISSTPGHKILMRDMPPRIRRIDLVICSLPPPYPNVLKAKYWFYRWPDGDRAGELIYDSDRCGWFGYPVGWFRNKVRTAKRLYRNAIVK